jgi:uncharacterized protein
MRYLILLGIVFCVVWWIKLNRATSARKHHDDNDSPPQNMVRCAHCGLHLPENEAIHSNKAVYCSQAHRALAED